MAEEKPQQQPMSRRGFCRRLGAAGVAAAGAVAGGIALHQPNHHVPGLAVGDVPLPRLPSFSVELGASDPRFAVAHGTDIDKMVEAATGELAGADRVAKFIRQGDIVALKPNVAFDRPPQMGATTRPETIKAVARMVHRAGAAEIRIFDNPINHPEGCFAKSGITAAIRELEGEMNIRLVLPTPSQFELIRVGGVAIRDWETLFRPLLGVDKLIGIAPLKNHNLCHASMTMKNWYGLLGGRRNQFHQDIHNVIADLAFMIAPTLVVLDATRILTRNGPTGGSPADVKPGDAIIVGTDQVAVDAFGAETFLEYDIEKIDYLRLAHERGIGRMDWRDVVWREIVV